MPVDRRYRERLANGIAAFMRQETNSDELGEIVHCRRSKDVAAREAAKQVWLFFDDLTDHRVCVYQEQWEQLRRWYAFLKTDYGLTKRTFSPVPSIVSSGTRTCKALSSASRSGRSPPMMSSMRATPTSR